MTQTVGILTIACPDRRGLVASVTSFLSEHGANILDSNQHSDLAAGVFFMRVAFDLEGMTLARNEIAPAFETVGQKFEMEWQLHFADELKNVAILVSQQDHCLYDLLLRHRAGEFQANLSLIISNHSTLEPIAQNFGIEWHYLPTTPDTKGQQEAAIMDFVSTAQD